jgi:F-type H+-transporting ATPase subunit a
MMLLWLAEHATEAAGAEGAHAAAEHGASRIPELPNLFGLLHHSLPELVPGLRPAFDSLNNLVAWAGFNDPMGTPFSAFENVLYALIVIIGLSVFFISGYRRLRKAPPERGKLSRRAMLLEITVTFFDDFFGQIMGRGEVRRHLPFVGTLFIYILCCNMLGLIWLGKAPTANLSFNLGMAALVFLYVHITGISRNPLGYIKHYPGALPTVKELGLGPAGYLLIGFMAILFTVIHILEALIQPLSLSLRLFGNMLGKDVLLGVFGSLMLIPIYAGIGIYFPWHTPFLFLGLLLGAIQALIFSLLSAVYIMLWLPHDEHQGEGH